MQCKKRENANLRPLHNEVKRVLGIKESNFNAKNWSNVSHLFTVRASVVESPLELAANFQDGSEPAKTLSLRQVLNCNKTPQI